MTDTPSTFIEPAAIPATLAALKTALAAGRTAQEILRWLQRRQVYVLLLGAGGTGKSTLRRYLRGDESIPTEYSESMKIENGDLDTIWSSHVLDVPGQAARRDSAARDAFEKVRAYKGTIGIIHVVSYGYHASTALRRTDLPDYRSGMSDEEFRIRYSTSRRTEELSVLEENWQRIADLKQAVWMFTVVLKQDLWWSERYAVREHYSGNGSPYEEMVQRIRGSRGANHFQHEILSASLVRSNLKLDDGAVLVPTASGYDDDIYRVHRMRLLSEILKFAREGRVP